MLGPPRLPLFVSFVDRTKRYPLSCRHSYSADGQAGFWGQDLPNMTGGEKPSLPSELYRDPGTPASWEPLIGRPREYEVCAEQLGIILVVNKQT